MENRSVPVSTVLPHLVYRDPVRAAEWLVRVFGFSEIYRYGEPVSGIQMRLGDAVFMLTGAREGTESPTVTGFCTQTLTVFLDDVESHYAHAKGQGAVIWEQLHETFYGEQQYGVKDLDSHRWLFSKHVRNVHPADWGATVAK